MAGSYKILVEAVLNKTNLQGQLDQMGVKPIALNIDQSKIASQAQQVKNTIQQVTKGTTIIDVDSNNRAIEAIKAKLLEIKPEAKDIITTTNAKGDSGNINYTDQFSNALSATAELDKATGDWNIQLVSVSQNLGKIQADLEATANKEMGLLQQEAIFENKLYDQRGAGIQKAYTEDQLRIEKQQQSIQDLGKMQEQAYKDDADRTQKLGKMQEAASKEDLNRTNASLKLQQDSQNQIVEWQDKLAVMQSKNPGLFNSAAMEEDVTKTKAMIAEWDRSALGKGAINDQLEHTSKSMQVLANSTKDVTHDGMEMGDMMGIAAKKFIIWQLVATAVMQAIQGVGSAIQYVKDLNKEFVNIAMITDKSNADVGALLNQYNGLARALGSTTLEVAKSAEVWLRQGKSIEDTNTLLKASTELSKMAGISSQESSTYLTAILNGFKMNASEVTSVLDKLVILANSSSTTASVSMQQLSEALQKSSNSAVVAGLNFNQLLSYIATIETTTQKDAGSIGQSLDFMMARFQAVKAGALVDDFGEPLNNVEKSLKSIGVETRNLTDGTFRPFGDVLDDLAKKWDSLGVKQAEIAGSVAGMRNRENFLALMNNYNKALDYQKGLLDSAGKSNEAYSRYLDGVDAAANRLTSDWQLLVSTMLSSDAIKGFYNLADAVVDATNKLGGLYAIWEKFHLLGPNALGLAAMAGDVVKQSISDKEDQKSVDPYEINKKIKDLEYTKNDILSKPKLTSFSDEANKQVITSIDNEISRLKTLLIVMQETDNERSRHTNAIKVQAEAQKAANADAAANTDEAKRIQKYDRAVQESAKITAGATANQYESMQKIIDTMNQYGEVSVAQADAIEKAFPEKANQIIDNQNGILKINVQALKDATLAEIEKEIATLTLAGGTDTINAKYVEQINLLRALEDQIKNGSVFSGDVKTAQKDQQQSQQAYNTLLKDTISMIKQETQSEIDSLQAKLSHYKDIIDAKKTMLDQMKTEKEYNNTIKDDNKAIADIDNQLLALQFDNSDAAKAKRLQLEADKAKQVEGLDKTQYDHSITTQKEALDKEYQDYANTINKKVKKLQDFLKQEGTITAMAEDMLNNHTDETLKKLESYWSVYGNTTLAELKKVEDAWKHSADNVVPQINKMTEATRKYLEELQKAHDALDVLGGNNTGIDATSSWADSSSHWGNFGSYDSGTSNVASSPIINLHGRHSGILSGFVGGLPTLQEGEEFSKLMKGEIVVNPKQQKDFMADILPRTVSAVASMSGSNGDINVTMPITIAGNADKTTVAEFKTAVTDVMIDVFRKSGMKRGAFSFSV